MIVRVWRTGVRESAYSAYQTFAQNISAPMFRQQPGCLGVLFTRDGTTATTITFWRDEASIAALADSPSYQETVARIMAAEVLSGDQTVSTYQVFGGQLDLETLKGEIDVFLDGAQ